MANNTETNLVGMLREKTEEADLKQYLKSTMGGYTKKSVTEYIAVMRKKQQATTETFNQNVQTLLEEKETLKKENESLLYKITQIESDFQILSETMKIHDLENSEFSLSDIISLKSSISAHEAENKKQLSENKDLKKKIDRLKEVIADKDTDLEKSSQETKIQKELLAAEKIETKKQRELVSQLSGTVEDLRDEIRYLKEMVAEGKVTKLSNQINELMVSISLQEELLSHKSQEIETKETMILTLTEENSSIKESMEHLAKSLDSLMMQNEKLVSSTHVLSRSLENEQKKSTILLNEKSEETVEKLILNRKLTEVNQKLSMMEMDSRKTTKTNLPYSDADDISSTN